MPVNPNIPLSVMTPADAREQQLNNNLKEQQVQINKGRIEEMEAAKGQPNYDEIGKKIDIGMKILSTVHDQASYDRARQLAAQYGIDDLDMLPDQYDPQIIEQLGRATLTFSEQLKMQREDNRMAFDREKFEYGKEKDQQAQQFNQDKLALDQQKQDRLTAQDERKLDLSEKKYELEMRKYMDELDKEEQKAQDPYSNLEPMPIGALKEVRDDVAAIGLSGQINADLSEIIGQIDRGELDLGLFKNMGSQARNFFGNTTEVSRNYDSFIATLNKLRNDSLRLNKGVQTEGDAQRAWDELVKNVNDPQLVRERLEEVRAINQRAAGLRKMSADMVRQNYGRAPLPSLIFDQPAAVGSTGDGFTPVNPGQSLRDMEGGGQEDPITAELRRRGAI